MSAIISLTQLFHLLTNIEHEQKLLTKMNNLSFSVSKHLFIDEVFEFSLLHDLCISHSTPPPDMIGIMG